MNFLANNYIFETQILGSSISDYFVQSNFAGQVIIIILLVLSVMAWGVMFCKYADLSTIEQLNLKTSKKLSGSANLFEATANTKSIASPYSKLLKDAMATLTKLGSVAKGNTAMRVSMIENTLARALNRETSKYEDKMTLLGTIISGAPFLGLLGTAWGVMDCFGSMEGQTSVTLQQLAPGVSGALLTTVAGLVVAIPSVFGYNFLSTKIKKMSVDIENFAGEISDIIEIEATQSNISGVATRTTKPTPVVENPTVRTTPTNEKVIDFSLDDDSEEISSFDDE